MGTPDAEASSIGKEHVCRGVWVETRIRARAGTASTSSWLRVSLVNVRRVIGPQGHVARADSRAKLYPEAAHARIC